MYVLEVVSSHTPLIEAKFEHIVNNTVASNVHNRTLALGGLYQCVDLVTQIAWHGRVEKEPYITCLNSLFIFNPKNYEEVYGDIHNLKVGFKVLQATLNRQNDTHALERTQYSVMLIYLENKLRKNSSGTEGVRAGIQAAAAQLEHFDLTHINIISNLADIYRERISPLGPRIIVKGEESALANPDNASRIRALLLAGIRSALLWRQAGGNRWRLIFERKAMLQEIYAMPS